MSGLLVTAYPPCVSWTWVRSLLGKIDSKHALFDLVPTFTANLVDPPHKELTHTIQLHPQYFGPHLRTFLIRRLYDDVEGTCSGRYGYIVSVVEIVDIGRGLLQATSGFAEFHVLYKAIVFKPFKNQVVDGVVSTVNKMGFFADVGPLQVFVSSHLIPSYLKFDPNSNPPAYAGESQDTQDIRIEKGEMVRMRIVGTRVDATEIFAIGSIKEDYLGPVQLS